MEDRDAEPSKDVVGVQQTSPHLGKVANHVIPPDLWRSVENHLGVFKNQN